MKTSLPPELSASIHAALSRVLTYPLPPRFTEGITDYLVTGVVPRDAFSVAWDDRPNLVKTYPASPFVSRVMYLLCTTSKFKKGVLLAYLHAEVAALNTFMDHVTPSSPA